MPLYVAYSLVPMHAGPCPASHYLQYSKGQEAGREPGNEAVLHECIPRVDYFILSHVKGQHVLCNSVYTNKLMTLCQYIFTHHQHTPCNYTVCCIEMQ